MPMVSLVLGVVLLLLGIGGYVASDKASLTALIPAAFGLPFFVLGVLAQARPSLRKHAMHAAAVLALIGFFGTARGLSRIQPLLSGAEVARPVAVVVQSIMAVLCLLFLALAIRSFTRARRSRTA